MRGIIGFVLGTILMFLAAIAIIIFSGVIGSLLGLTLPVIVLVAIGLMIIDIISSAHWIFNQFGHKK